MTVAQPSMPSSSPGKTPPEKTAGTGNPEKAVYRPPLAISPGTWNWIYWSILMVSFTVSLATLVSSGDWAQALLRFFVVLLGLSFLAVAFVGVVVVPLQRQAYERTLEARRAALAELLAEEEAEEETSSAEAPEEPDPELLRMVEEGKVTSEDLAALLAAAQAAARSEESISSDSSEEGTFDDQAAGLRRLMNERAAEPAREP